MAKVLTDRDKKILAFFEDKYFADIGIIAKAFFHDIAYGYQVARDRLKVLEDYKYIKRYRDSESLKNVYVWNNRDAFKDGRQPTVHNMLALKVYAEIASWGATIDLLDVEKTWTERKYRSDGLIVFTLGSKRFYFWIESVCSNNPFGLEKYDEIKKSGLVEEYITEKFGKPYFPQRLILVSNRKPNNVSLQSIKQIITVPENLNQLVTILFPAKDGTL